jgi:hypothetical protein
MKLQVLNLANGEFILVFSEVSEEDFSLFEENDWESVKRHIGVRGFLVFETPVEVVN